MTKSIFTGSAVAIVTPFTNDGVDFETYGQLIEFQIANGTDAIVVLGTTGEPPTMTEKEKLDTIEYAVKKINGRVPVIVGAGCNCTKDTIDRALEAENLGADALLVVTPYYNKCTQQGLIQHFTQVADSVHIPMILYNVPGRTGVNIQAPTMKILAQHPRIVGIKEASGNIQQISDMCDACGDNADVFSGDDGITLPILALGGKGVISVAANIVPQFMHDLCQMYFDGNIEGARKAQFKVNPLVSALFSEVNPIPVKTALGLMGYRVGPLRLPLTPMEEKNVNLLKTAMKDFGINF